MLKSRGNPNLESILSNTMIINTVSIIGTICSIISLIFSIFIFFYTKSLKEKYTLLTQSKQLKKDRVSLVNDLKSCSDLLSKNDNDYAIQDLARILRLLENYSLSMDKKDKRNLKKLRKFVNSRNVTNTDVQVAINGIIGFLQSNHDKTLDIM